MKLDVYGKCIVADRILPGFQLNDTCKKTLHLCPLGGVKEDVDVSRADWGFSFILFISKNIC